MQGADKTADLLMEKEMTRDRSESYNSESANMSGSYEV